MIDKKLQFSQWDQDHILSKFTKNTWLLDKIFWGEGIILYNEDKEKAKRLLKEVYWYDKIYDLFEPELDEEKIDRTLRTIFRFNDLQLPDDVNEPWISLDNS
jgi:hypothetical protein